MSFVRLEGQYHISVIEMRRTWVKSCLMAWTEFYPGYWVPLWPARHCYTGEQWEPHMKLMTFQWLPAFYPQKHIDEMWMEVWNLKQGCRAWVNIAETLKQFSRIPPQRQINFLLLWKKNHNNNKKSHSYCRNTYCVPYNFNHLRH